MLSPTQDFLFALLRNALFGSPIAAAYVPAQPDWKALFDEARKQTVCALVAEALNNLPSGTVVPEDVRQKFAAYAIQVMMTHKKLDDTLALCAKTLREAGIRGVLLKGQGNARLYPQPLLRQCGDIDMYVGIPQYERTVQVCLECFDDGTRDNQESIKHMHFGHDNVRMEIHRVAAISYDPRYRRKFQNWMVSELENPERCRQIEVNGETVNLPSWDFNALFIFYHAWFHLLTGGIGLRQLCDWAMALHRGYGHIDIAALGRNLTAFGIMGPWQTMACILVDHLGLPEAEMPYYDPALRRRADKALDMIMEGGNFGQHAHGITHANPKDPFLIRKLRTLARITKTYTRTIHISPSAVTGSYLSFLASGTANVFRQAFSRH